MIIDHTRNGLVAVLMLVLCHSTICGAAPTAVYSDVDEKLQVRLRWRVDAWPDDCAGFSLSRRTVSPEGADGDWQRIGPEIIVPDFSNELLERFELKSVIAKKKSFKTIPRAKSQIRKYRSDREELERSLLLSSVDFEWAIPLGFGWIDTSAKSRDVYDYRVAWVKENAADAQVGEGLVGETRIAVKYGAIECPEVVDFKAVRHHRADRVRVSWKIRTSDLEARNDIRKFNVLAGSVWHPLSERATFYIGTGDAKEDQEFRSFSVWHEDAPSNALKYAIAPVNFFDRQGLLSDRIVVPRKGATLAPPKGLTAEVKDEQIALRWDHAYGASGTFGGFRVDRKFADDPDYAPITNELLPRGRRTWYDPDGVDAYRGEELHYRVTAVANDGRDSSKPAVVKVYVPFGKPEPPADLRVAVEGVGGARSIVCSWDASPSPGVGAYVVSSLDPVTGLWTRETIVQGKTDVRLPVKGSWKGERWFRCKAETVDGTLSEPSIGRSVVIPPEGTLDPVDSISIMPVGNSVHISWVEPVAPELTGFRITAGEKVIADETVLGPYVRRWRHWPMTTDIPSYSVVKVDAYDRASAPVVAAAPEPVEPEPAKPAEPVGDVIEKKSYFRNNPKQVRAEVRMVELSDGSKVRHGLYRSYYADGKVRYECPYHMNKPHGVVRRFLEENGALKEVRLMRNGEKIDLAEFEKVFGADVLTDADRAWLQANPGK